MDSVRKIVVIGGESTGKSTLCARLASAYDTCWVREYAREYLEKLNRAYVFEDLVLIANGQIKLEEIELAKANNFLFCDTDLQVIKIWSQVKYNLVDDFILKECKKNKASLYILCDPDFPWEFDELRENEFDRNSIHQLYLDELNTNGLNYIVASGSLEQRKKYCVECITKQFSTYL